MVMETNQEDETRNSQLQDAEEAEAEAEATQLVSKIESELIENPILVERLLDRPKVMAIVSRTAFRGPLPPPAMLKEYRDIIPNGAERIMAMSEREQEHRHTVTKTAVGGAVLKDKRGQWMAYSITLIILAIATMFAWKGQTVFAGTLITVDLIGLASVFAIGRITKNNSDDEAP